MICNCVIKKSVCLIICGVIVVHSLVGCSKFPFYKTSEHNYKSEADEEVYNIIDQKWQEDFGSKANYKISDTEPLPVDVQVEKSVPAFGVLTLPQAVALATAHNWEYQSQREALYIKALDLRLTQHEFETQFFGGKSVGYSADRNDEVFSKEAKVGFNRLLAGGTRISTELTIACANVLSGNLRGGLAAILSATVTQPLLRGSDRRVVLENLTQAERDVVYQVRSFNRFRQMFVVSVISEYYRVLQLFDGVGNAKSNYDTLTWLTERVEKLANAGRVPMLELERIRQDTLNARDLYIQSEKEYKQALDEFKITLGLPATTEFQLDEIEMEALRPAIKTIPDFSQDQVIEAALCRRLDLANSADAIIDAQRKVFVATDGLRADLNLVGSASAITSRRANRGTLGWLREEYGLGFELDLPLDRVAEQNIYRKALVTLNLREREYALATDMVTLEVRQAYRGLREAAERYQVLSDSLQLAQKRLENTFLLLQYGRASSRRVLDAQNGLFDARNAATEALVNYAVSTLNFYRDTGVLQVRPDGMWEL